MTRRLVDVSVSLLALCVLSPLLVAVSAAIRLTMGRPVFFRQTRIGRNGLPFTILKFRTMAVQQDSEALAVENDARVTRLGAMLRRCKLDEFPQLVNVLRGDMSLVGPRPEIPRFVSLYDENQRRVLEVRPGLTDPASIRYRDEQSVLSAGGDPERTYVERVMPDKLRINLEYLRRRSLLSDLQVLVDTGRVLFCGRARRA